MDIMASQPVENPSAVYLAGRREWNERYGSYISRANRANLLSTVLAVALAVSGLGNAWQASQSHVEVLIERVNQLGELMGVQAVPPAPPPNSLQIKAHLEDWVRDVRAVYSDPSAELNVTTQAFDYTEANSSAVDQLLDWFRTNNPNERAERELVGVGIESATIDGSGTWEVDWHEDHTPKDGSGPYRDFWKVTLNIVVHKPTDEPHGLKNPDGVYVRWFNFSLRTGVSGKGQ